MVAEFVNLTHTKLQCLHVSGSTWHKSVGRVQNPGKRVQICERQQKLVQFTITNFMLHANEGDSKSV